jgi:hypothetical protein
MLASFQTKASYIAFSYLWSEVGKGKGEETLQFRPHCTHGNQKVKSKVCQNMYDILHVWQVDKWGKNFFANNKHMKLNTSLGEIDKNKKYSLATLAIHLRHPYNCSR